MRVLEPQAVPLAGAHLVEASAGTGKTYTITSLYLRLVLEGGLGVDRILVVTFTRAATAELRDRLRARLRAASAALEAGGDAEDPFLDGLVRARVDPGADRRRVLEELRRFDEAAIFTIHGFCQRVLQDHAFESGVAFDAQLAMDSDALYAEVAQDYWTERVCGAEPAFIGFLRQQGAGPSGLVGLAKLALAEADQALLPPPGPDRYAAALLQVETAHRAVQARWPGDRDAVAAATQPSPALKANMWKAATHARRLARLDALLGPEAVPPSAVDKDWECFTPGALARATRKGHAPPEHPLFDALALLVAAVETLAEESRARLLRLQLEFLDFARRETRQRRDAVGTLTFEDLLQRLDAALGGPEGATLGRAVRRRYGAALIDEFQDTDPIQYRIFRRLFDDGQTPLFLIGDPKQAIYGFRSADVFAYLEAAAAVGDERYTLETNWRSDPRLIAAVNRVFSRAAAPFVFEGIPFAPVSPRPGAADALVGPAPWVAPLEVLYVPADALQTSRLPVPKGEVRAHLPALVASEIGRLLGAGVSRRPGGDTAPGGTALRPGDVAVLVRRNAEGRAIQDALREVGLPSVLHSDASVFDTAEAEELVILLGALAQPSHGRRLRLALATPLVGLGGAELLALGEQEARWEAWILRFRRWAELFGTRGFLPAYARIFAELDVAARTLSTPAGERRLTNLIHLGELLHLAARRQRVGPEGLARWLALARQGAELEGVTDQDARQLRVESDARAVQVLTMHKCKGLEFPVVYCPYLWAGDWGPASASGPLRFHDPAAAGRRTLDLGSPDWEAHRRLAQRESLAEGLRLAYVALTRARHRCTVLWGPWRGVSQSALGYLLHQGEVAPEPAETLWERAEARIGGLEEAALRADLEALAAGSEGAILVREARLEGERFQGPAPREPRPLACRVFRTAVERLYRTSSFSALVGGAAAPLSPASNEGLDRDEGAPLRLPNLAPPEAMPEAATPAAMPAPDPPRAGAPALERTDLSLVSLHAFPRGARAGNLLHHLLETLDFQAPAEERSRVVARALVRHGVDPEAWTPRLEAAVAHWLNQPLAVTRGAPVVLGALPAGARRAELEFVLPVAQAGSAAPAVTLLTPGRLAAVFAAHGAEGPHLGAYAARLAGLRRLPLHGYLRGFIDLVFRQEDRYHLLDWKSNHLGARPADYAPARLREVMVADHYVLQYHLYMVALHRHLQARLPGYDYERHVGDAHYLFLRGMVPEGGPEAGVFRDRPSRGLLEDLCAVMDGGAGPAPAAAPGTGGRHG